MDADFPERCTSVRASPLLMARAAPGPPAQDEADVNGSQRIRGSWVPEERDGAPPKCQP